jgi:hypothetical protein
MLKGYEARGCLFSTTSGCIRVDPLCSACRFRARRKSLQDKGELDFTKQVQDSGIRGMTVLGVSEGPKDWMLRRLGLRENEDVVNGMVVYVSPWSASPPPPPYNTKNPHQS